MYNSSVKVLDPDIFKEQINSVLIQLNTDVLIQLNPMILYGVNLNINKVFINIRYFNADRN